jgi:subtilisin family serine protease
VLDAGFYNVDSLPSFEQMINDGRLMGTRNFVDNIPVFRSPSSHGMSVLSIMGAEWNGHMVGTAPRASYFLCITENSSSESRIEEIAWIEAAEFLDSLGCDVFNTSLGYSVFDRSLFDYAYENMDGQTTFISRAASMTASKGIICCVSAGNEGNKSWYYLTAPSDASDILGVGAVDDLGQISNFSSRGPSFDGRVKPDVVATGKLAWIQHWSGAIVQRDGTSFSSPLITGSVASLWQAYPTLPATEIMDAVRQSGDRYERPDDDYGYGLPSFSEALQSISSTRNNFRDGEMVVYPNPASDRVTIRIPGDNAGRCLTRLYDMTGRLILSRELELPGMLTIPPGHAGGICILEVNSAGRLFRIPLIIH